jgi:hypothetical protein
LLSAIAPSICSRAIRLTSSPNATPTEIRKDMRL